jgi:hypothetical protein
MHNPADEISQAERRRIMADDRRGQTYQGHAINDAELNLGGRFAQVQPTSVTGANPGSVYPRQPSTSPWYCDPVGPEPLIDGRGEGDKLGFAIDRPDAASTTAAPVVEEPPSPPGQVITSGGDVGPPPKFKRRF